MSGQNRSDQYRYFGTLNQIRVGLECQITDKMDIVKPIPASSPIPTNLVTFIPSGSWQYPIPFPAK